MNRLRDRRRATLAATRIAVAQTTHTMWLAANAHGVAAPILRLQRQGTPITLVGVMHYNPASCELVRSTILEEPALGAVCVELCDARFNAFAQFSMHFHSWDE